MKSALVVDDEPGIVEFVRDALKTLGWEVHCATNGKVAAGVLREHPEVTLIITDIVMPEADGLFFIHQIRAEKSRAQPKVIAMTGGGVYGSTPLYLESAKLLGADAQLAKPFTLEDLEHALTALDS